ncbi:MAG: tetratricopeptide repeat protein [Acidobacteriota bacterium]
MIVALLFLALVTPAAPAAVATTPDPGLDAALAPATGLTESGEPGELFVRANTAYEDGDYGRAVRLYEGLIERGVDNGRLHYNLGNAYLRAGELGRAIASYRRAQSALPRDQDTAANLAFARRSARDALSPPGPSAVQRTLFFWHYRLSRQELFAATLGLNLLFWGLLGWRLYRPNSEILRWLTGLVLIPLLAVAASWATRTISPQRVAVIVPQEINVQSGTSRDSVVLFKLHAGAELAVLDERPDWLRIALPDGEQGWLESQHTELLIDR